MGEESGVRWAKLYLERGFPDRYTPLIAMFAELETRLASGRVASVHQVGCCSGREIAYFAKRFPCVAFTGSDSDPEIVDFLRGQWRELGNLRFVQLRMETSDDAEMENLRADLVYASGGLHYMDPSSLLRFFTCARALSSALLLSQPLTRPYPAGDAKESMPRGQLSWNHPYPSYLRQAGWSRVDWSEGLSEELPTLKNISAWAGA
jgi:cyclopropane fatty-acyl-phospholipid synthase-like methyltransferase